MFNHGCIKKHCFLNETTLKKVLKHFWFEGNVLKAWKMGIYLSKLRDFKYFLDCPQLTKEWEIIPASPWGSPVVSGSEGWLVSSNRSPETEQFMCTSLSFCPAFMSISCFTTKHCVGLSFPELRDSSRILISGVWTGLSHSGGFTTQPSAVPGEKCRKC